MLRAVYVLFSVLLFLGSCDRNPLLLGQQVSFRLDEKTTAAYSVQVPAVAPSGKLYVVVSSSSNDFYGPPQVRMTLDKHELVCFSGPTSTICTAHSRLIQPGWTFKVDVSCVTQCSHTIKAYIDRDFQLKLEDEMMAVLGEEGDTFEAVVEVPKNAQFTEIRVLATLSNAEEATGSLELFVNAADNVERPSLNNHQYRGEQIWNDGVGVFLDSDKVKPGNLIRLLLKGSKGTVASVTCFSVQNNSRNIISGQQIYDAVETSKRKVYVLDLSSYSDIKTSGNVDIKLIKYVGNSRVLVSPDDQFKRDKIIDGNITESLTQMTINPKTRQALGYSSKFYIAVSGDEDSTFMLQASLSHDDYVVLESDIAEMSSIVGDEVDSYIYSFVGKDSAEFESNFRHFYISLEVVSEDVDFGVIRCRTLEKDGSHDCLLKNLQEVKSNPELLSEITGDRHDRITIKAFTFRYDVRQCTPQHEGTYRCSFLVFCYNPNNTTNAASYVLNFWELGEEMTLQESVPKRVRAVQGQIDRFEMKLPSTTGITSVKFLMTVISGSCFLSGATDRRQHNFTDPQIRLAIKDIVIFNGSISKEYYLNVRCFQPSYYSLLAVILRDANTSTQYLQLTEGVAQQFYLHGTSTDQFYLRLTQAVPLILQTTDIKGRVKYEVHPSERYNVREDIVWQSEPDGSLSIDNEQRRYSKSNEFIVRVTATEPDSIFSIVYIREGECPLYNTNRPTLIELPENENRCYEFNLNSGADVQVVVASSYFDMTTGGMNVSYTLNGSQSKRLLRRVSTIKLDEIKKSCPSSVSGADPCPIKVTFQSVSKKSINMIVQEQDGQIELFDGLEQHTSCLLSRGRSKQFYYEIPLRKPITLTLRSSSHTRYRLMARLANMKDLLLTNTLFPSYEDVYFYYSDTNPMGDTMMVITHNETSEYDKGYNLLLISVFSHSVVEQEVTFQLEVMQQTVKMRPSEVKSGFVEKGENRRYSLSTDGTKQLLVHANTHTVHCLKLELIHQQQNKNGTTTEEILARSMTGELIIAPSKKPTKYIVEVTGFSSCSYELSYTNSDLKIFELLHGKIFNLELRQGQFMYLLYFHTNEQPFRLITMGESGAVRYDARIIPEGSTANIPEYVKNLDGPWQFGETNRQQSLIIDPKKASCLNCHYLIRVGSDTAAAALVVVHSIDSTVVLRQNRIVRETLSGDLKNITYALFKSKSFRFTLEVIYGTLDVEVTHTSNGQVNIHQTVNESIEIPVNYFSSTKNYRDQNSLHNGSAFLIKIGCNESCSFSIVVDVDGFPRRLVDGLPHQLLINYANNSSCVQFLSLEQTPPTYLLLALENITSIRYDIKCFRTDNFKPCEHTQDLIASELSGSNSKSIELRSFRGYYLACFSLLENDVVPQTVTITHTTNNNLRYLTPNSYNLMSTSVGSRPIEVEMYNPGGLETMVEVFECKGTVDLEVTVDYEKFQKAKPDFTQNSRVAGHKVMRLHTDIMKQPMSFSRLSTMKDSDSNDSIIIFRYGYYQQKYFPYDELSVGNESITYTISANEVYFTVPAVIANKRLVVVTATYNLYIAKTSEEIKTAVQCQTNQLFNQSITVGVNDAESSEIIFKVDIDEIEEVVSSGEYFFVGVYAQAETAERAANVSLTSRYRFIYNQLQMSIFVPHIAESSFERNLKSVMLWVIFPAIAIGLLIFVSWQWFRRHSKKHVREIQIREDPEEFKTESNEGVGVTISTKHLIMRDGVMSNPQIPEV